MFRYLALAWDDSLEGRAAAAQQFVQTVRSKGTWIEVLRRPGLHVFTTGATSRAHDAFDLDDGRGVVVGALFRQGDQHPGESRLRLGAAEQVWILETRGRRLIEDFWGRYVAFLAGPAGTMVLRDPSGTLPCYLLRADGVDIVFSWLDDLLDLFPWVPTPAVDWERLSAQIAFLALSGRQTALCGVSQVLPGERVTLACDQPRSTPLWDPVQFASRAAGGEDHDTELEAALRRTVQRSVQAWARSWDHVLLRLSGGLDSAIVLACLEADDIETRITCVNHHSPGANSDERPYARLAAQAGNRELIEMERDAAFPLESVLDVARTPIPATYIGRLGPSREEARLSAQIGAPALFTGGGGDQLFFELKGWWPAADHLRIRGPFRGFGSAVMDAARLTNLTVWRVLRMALLDRMECVACDADLSSGPSLAVPLALPEQSDWRRYAHPALSDARRLPTGKRRHLQQVLYLFDDYDPYERAAAPETLNPLHSQPVIELCLATPTYRLIRGGRGRALARAAFADAVPRAILQRHAKGGMQEYVTDLLYRNLPFVRETLMDGELVKRGLLDRAKVEAALSDRFNTTTASIVELHNGVAIEAWLRQMGSR